MPVLTKEAQEKLKNSIINRLLTDLEKPLADSISKGLLEKLDLSMIIDEVRSRIPLPQNGKDAEVTDDLISMIVVRVLERVQELHQVKDGRDGKDGIDGKDYVLTERDRNEIASMIPRPKDGIDGRDYILTDSDKRDISEKIQRPRDGKDGSNYILTSSDIDEIIRQITPKIRIPKDGKDGRDGNDGNDGNDGKDYIISEEDFRAIVDKIDLDNFVAKEELDKIIAKLIWDIKSGEIELPVQGGFGEALANEALIREINRVLGQSDWQNGLPGDGTIGGNLDWLNLTDDPTGVPSGAGVMNWNKNELSLDVQTGVGPILQVGQEVYILICNCTGAPIDNFTALRPLGATVKNGVVIPTVELAKADEFATSEGTLMVSTMDIPDDTIGLATRFGRVRDADTSTFSDGDGLFLSASVAGGFTNVQPAFPNYAISMGGVVVSDAIDGEFFVSITRDIFDTTINFWNGVFRESINFLVSSNGTVVTGSLSPANGHPDMTMMFSDGLSMLTTTPAATITLTPGTDDTPQQNFIYVPKTTKVLTLSTSGWPEGTEHIKVATVLLRSASTTQTDGALKNHNWNDHIQSTIDNQGHLSHLCEKLRQFEAQWDSGAQTTASGFPSNFYVASTAGVVYQLHRQTFPAQSMPTDDIHVVNNFAAPYVTTTNLNTQVLDSQGNSLANSSFSFVVWGVQNKSGQTSHLMCNLPVGVYAKNSPALAVSDAFNYSVYTIPKEFQGTGFLLARFTLILEADGTTWTLYDTEDLRGRIPNATAGGGGGGSGVTEWTALSDTPSAYTSQAGKVPRVNSGETALDFTSVRKEPGLKSGTLASPPTGLLVDELWEDTTDSATHPILRVSKTTT